MFREREGCARVSGKLQSSRKAPSPRAFRSSGALPQVRREIPGGSAVARAGRLVRNALSPPQRVGGSRSRLGR
jgi:hypothetical protein